ncbi:hypothetical protein [Marinomonas mediterranea]|uniref:Lipoprotein n=1 Tax=Marinomonas mediterranea (strain ATCC 700492 / JCM 21426 / NBRC 103028 / MMB-1) TaxID=717774 RepID=F2JYN6_MARM1|nr:hypothetical protein [Marinomonas mediterranea]ADZ89661.1 hypothetical protein Marme_0360 [Marinomonas mediterranea MMB-1]WCN07753.1 hypothetical protein GV055_01840 [Marinomonas mediterranea]WCN11853.1 hypothetical protein GV054_01865 [Marinomonas mediterranea]WCN15898.1 hypothetical protein GV053_01815 [Marinomonas mediterranea MMB-1]
MNKIRSIVSAIAMSIGVVLLVGCKSLPQPEEGYETLVLAPFEANIKAKTNGYLVTHFILNNDPNLSILIDPPSGVNDFNVNDTIPAGEYEVTGYRIDAASRNRIRASGGKGKVYPLQDGKTIPLIVKNGEMTIFPITVEYELKHDKDAGRVRTHIDFHAQDSEEREELIKRALEMENADKWVLSNQY